VKLFTSLLVLMLMLNLTGCGSSSDSSDSSSSSGQTKNSSQKENDNSDTSSSKQEVEEKQDNVSKHKNETISNTKTSSKKLLAIYMVGSDLEGHSEADARDGLAGTDDLKELFEGLKKLYPNIEDPSQIQDLDIVVAFGGANRENWKGMRIANISQLFQDYKDDGEFGNLDEYLFKDESFNMGDKSSLTYFFNFLKENSSEEYNRTFLTMWDHGGAYGDFGNDSNFNNDGLSLAEIQESFNSADVKFDIIGFDACLNGNIEVANNIAQFTDYLIASEETEPGHGWNWSAVIQSYKNAETISKFGTELVDNFVKNESHTTAKDSKGDFKTGGEKTLSITDMANFNNLLEKLNIFASNLSFNLENNFQAVTNANNQAQKYGAHNKGDEVISIDLKHFVTILKNNISDETLKNNIDELIQAIDLYVIHSNQDGSKPNSFGVSIAPLTVQNYSKDTQAVSDEWFALIENYRKISQGDTTQPEVSAKDVDDGIIITASDNLAIKDVSFVIGVSDENNNFMFLEATPIEKQEDGTFFTKYWDGKLLNIKYGTGENDNLFVPILFDKFVEINGETYFQYISFIDDGDKTNEETLMILTDSDKNLVDYYIEQNQIDANGNIIFDRDANDKEFKTGDKYQFTTMSLNSDNGEDKMVILDDITFTQTPQFEIKTSKEFEEIEFQYMIFVEDSAGNIVYTTPEVY